MSQENVETARRAFEAFNRTFTEGTPDYWDLLDPEVEWIPMSALLEGTRYHGHDGVRQWIEEMRRDWTTFEVGPKRFVDLRDDRVLIMGTWRAQGRGGGVLLEFSSGCGTRWRPTTARRSWCFTARGPATMWRGPVTSTC